MRVLVDRKQFRWSEVCTDVQEALQLHVQALGASDHATFIASVYSLPASTQDPQRYSPGFLCRG